ncbi:MAG: polyamine ABC transporter substrate-binding protein [Defluviicoccus sp.]|nr:polyamine ABC transporter substrate-binding protein [Defluviicoccus sp.]
MRGAVKTCRLAGLAMLLAGSAALAEAPMVRVYNWSDYIDPAILAGFEAETGIRAVYDTFDSNRTLEAKLAAGNSGYDVVVPSGSLLARRIGADGFRPLEKSRLANLGNLDPAIMARVRRWDPGNRHAVPYMWGTTGIGFNRDMIAARDPAAPIGSWGMLFDPATVARFADCGVWLLDEPDEAIPAALAFLGEDPDSHDTRVIARAEAALAAIRPHVGRFHNSAQIEALAQGEICLAMGWSGDMLQARERARAAGQGVAVDYAIPPEGAQMWFDLMAIPADAPSPGNAHRFIDYLMRPEVIARASNHVFYANANAASAPHLDPALARDPAIYPPPALRAKLFVTRPWPDEVRRFAAALWERVKRGR